VVAVIVEKEALESVKVVGGVASGRGRECKGMKAA